MEITKSETNIKLIICIEKYQVIVNRKLCVANLKANVWLYSIDEFIQSSFHLMEIDMPSRYLSHT